MKFGAVLNGGKMFANYITYALFKKIINITKKEQNVKNIFSKYIEKYIFSIYNQYAIVLLM